jgi:hypothetical protein
MARFGGPFFWQDNDGVEEDGARGTTCGNGRLVRPGIARRPLSVGGQPSGTLRITPFGRGDQLVVFAISSTGNLRKMGTDRKT